MGYQILFEFISSSMLGVVGLPTWLVCVFVQNEMQGSRVKASRDAKIADSNKKGEQALRAHHGVQGRWHSSPDAAIPQSSRHVEPNLEPKARQGLNFGRASAKWQSVIKSLIRTSLEIGSGVEGGRSWSAPPDSKWKPTEYWAKVLNLRANGKRSP